MKFEPLPKGNYALPTSHGVASQRWKPEYSLPQRLTGSRNDRSLTRSNCRGSCDDELMTRDNRGDAAAAREAVADARREAAAALARLAGATVRYADARFAETTPAAATSGSPRIQRAKPGEFVADELAVMLRDQPYHARCLLARSRRLARGLPTVDWTMPRPKPIDASTSPCQPAERPDGDLAHAAPAKIGGSRNSMLSDHVMWVRMGASMPPEARRCSATTVPRTTAAKTSTGLPPAIVVDA